MVIIGGHLQHSWPLGVILGIEHIIVFTIVIGVDATKEKQRMGQRIGHQRTVAILLYGFPSVGMGHAVFIGSPYPERYLKFLACQPIVDIGRMHATIEGKTAVEALLTMVGHIDDDGIFVFKATDNLIDHRVVVEHSIIIVGIDLLTLWRQVCAVIVGRSKLPTGFHREARTVINVLAHEMEDGELVGIAFLCHHAVVVFKQSFVVAMEFGVALVEECTAQRGIV